MRRLLLPAALAAGWLLGRATRPKPPVRTQQRPVDAPPVSETTQASFFDLLHRITEDADPQDISVFLVSTAAGEIWASHGGRTYDGVVWLLATALERAIDCHNHDVALAEASTQSSMAELVWGTSR